MSSPEHHDLQPLRIVVTDDDPDKVYALTKTLRAAGHCIFSAYDGLSAFELMVQLPGLQLLITNTRLGSVDGPELIRRARAIFPNFPILHVSPPQAQRDGIPPDVPTLTEPFTPNQLLEAVATLMVKTDQSR